MIARFQPSQETPTSGLLRHQTCLITFRLRFSRGSNSLKNRASISLNTTASTSLNTQAMSGRDEGRQRGRRHGDIREVSFQPHIFEYYRHEQQDDITTTRRCKEHLLERDRVIHRVTDLDLMTSLIIRRGKERPFPRGRSRAPQDPPDQDFRSLSAQGGDPSTLWSLRPSAGDPYAPTTPVSTA